MPEIVLTRIRRGWLTRPAPYRRYGRAVVQIRTAGGALTIPVQITARAHDRFQAGSTTSHTAGGQR